jgi:hypothetical protein
MGPKDFFYTMKKKRFSFVTLGRWNDGWERCVSHCGCSFMTIIYYILFFTDYGFVK